MTAPTAQVQKVRTLWVGLVLALVTSSTLPSQAFAATYRTGDEVIVEPHEVIEDDLVVWSSYVRIDGTVKGDVTVLGSEVEIEGVIEGDLFAVAKTLHLNGSVGDDARIAAYAIAVGPEGRVVDDTFALAYSLETNRDSVIGGTLYAAVRQALVLGQVVEAIALRAEAVALGGLVGGDVRAIVSGLTGNASTGGVAWQSSTVIDLALEIPEVDAGLRLRDTAFIGGDLDYEAAEQARVDAGARVAGAIRHEPWSSTPSTGPAMPRFDSSEFGSGEGSPALERFLVLVLLGLLFVAAAPRWSIGRAKAIRTAPVQAFGWGLGSVVGLVFASLVIAVGGLTLLGVFFSSGGLVRWVLGAGFLLQCALFFPSMIALIYVAPVLASLGIGHWLSERLSPGALADSGFARAAAMAGAGAVVYAGLRAIPGIGPVVGFFGALIGLGALVLWLRGLWLLSALEPDEPATGDIR